MTLLRHRVAVTGSTGFIGMHLLRGLHAVGAEIVAIAGADKHIERFNGLPFPVEQVIVDDVCNLGDAIRRSKAEYVIHLSAFVSTERSLHALDETLRQNLLPTISLLTAAAEVQVARVVLMGSCEEYSQKTSPFDTALATCTSAAAVRSEMVGRRFRRSVSSRACRLRSVETKALR